MEIKRIITILLLSCMVAVGGCKKTGGDSVSGGGIGGAAVVHITPEFANYLIDTCTVYIKYGTHDAPADGVYDDSTVCVVQDTIPVATFTHLTTGIYYLYGVGYHAAGGHPPNVKGGQICTITKEDTVQLYLPTYPYIP